jgi:Protein of unknown function, DUF481
MTHHRHRLALARRFGGLVAVFCFAALSLCGQATDKRTKTDIVYMRNGDKITCEVKSLNQGQLSINPDYTATSFTVDWQKVARIESSQQFVITDPNGTFYVGSLTGDPEKHTVTIVSPEKATLSQTSVVEIAELGKSFVKRLSGNVNVGTSIAQSNTQSTITTQANLKYQDQELVFNLAENSQFASQKEAPTTNETTLKTSIFHQLPRPSWYYGGLANFLSSSEQQISLQTTLGGALARRMIFTNKTNLVGVAGLAYTVTKNEPGTTSTSQTNSFDAALSAQYSTFRFNSTTFDTTLWVYPSLSAPGHVRMTLNQDLYYKFWGNFTLNASFYDNFDNQPVVGAPANNLGISTGLGWSFP